MPKSQVPFRLKLKACRAQIDATQEEMAKMLGVSDVTIKNWESGISEPKLSQARKISDITGIPLDYIEIRDTDV